MSVSSNARMMLGLLITREEAMVSEVVVSCNHTYPNIQPRPKFCPECGKPVLASVRECHLYADHENILKPISCKSGNMILTNRGWSEYSDEYFVIGVTIENLAQLNRICVSELEAMIRELLPQFKIDKTVGKFDLHIVHYYG